MDTLEKISRISHDDHITGVQKIEIPKLEKISPNIKQERTKELKYFSENSKKEYTKQDVEKAVNSANRILGDERDVQYKFQVHEGTNRIMVKLIDRETEEVIKEIPSEKILDLIANIWERLGILVDERG